MYNRYEGLIFDMDGILLDTEPARCKALAEGAGRTKRCSHMAYSQAIIVQNNASLDPYQFAKEKSAVVSTLFDDVQLLQLVQVVKA